MTAALPPACLPTTRLVVRAWEPADAPTFHRLLVSEEPRLRRDFPRTLAAVPDATAAAGYLAEFQRKWLARTQFSYGLWTPLVPVHCVGFVSLRNMAWDELGVPKAELAYFLAGGFEGRGLMREALRAVLPAAFAVGVEKVFARVLPENHRSRQLLRAVGFQHGGRLRREFRTGDGRCVEADYFDLIATDLAGPLTSPAALQPEEMPAAPATSPPTSPFTAPVAPGAHWPGSR